MIESLKARIAEVEKAISDTLQNHRDLLVRADELKYLLNLASGIACAVAPDSLACDILEAADNAADAISE